MSGRAGRMAEMGALPKHALASIDGLKWQMAADAGTSASGAGLATIKFEDVTQQTRVCLLCPCHDELRLAGRYSLSHLQRYIGPSTMRNCLFVLSHSRLGVLKRLENTVGAECLLGL